MRLRNRFLAASNANVATREHRISSRLHQSDLHDLMAATGPLPRLLASTLTPFLYPCLLEQIAATTAITSSVLRRSTRNVSRPRNLRSSFCTSARCPQSNPLTAKNADVHQFDHLDPVPPDYSSQPFIDACTLTITAGSGGHGCISFLREMFIANGPPNGGDGGSGGCVYIQAVRGETSLHKIARRGTIKAGRGRNGQGSMRGGARGEDVVLVVPPGTVVREISRVDPLDEEERLFIEARKKRRIVEVMERKREQVAERRKAALEQDGEEGQEGENDADDLDERARKDAEVDDFENLEDGSSFRREKWLIYPGQLPKSFSSAEIPIVPRPRRSSLYALQPPEPFRLDLDQPMEAPMLLAAGAMGGLGNPHFITKALPKPKFALKGDAGVQIHLQLELKILADVGLVGLPNAGKSTLLRALTRSRTRVGNWAFTTLSPSIGTVVLDSHVGRPSFDTRGRAAEGRAPRDSFTIADIPGLIEGAHLDRGLGLGFLRHIERAAVLAFVVDLSAGDAVQALKALWHEVGMYEKLRDGDPETWSGAAEVPPTRHEGPSAAYQPFSSSMARTTDIKVPSVQNHHQSSPPAPDTAADDDDDDEDPFNHIPRSRPAPPPPQSLYSSPPSTLLPAAPLPPISSKPWLVVATKADLPETQARFAALQTYLAAVQSGEQPHPSGKPNAWRKRLTSVPVAAINKEGVQGLPGIILGLLDE